MLKGVSKIERLRLYLETTVFNYYFDDGREGHEDVVKLFEAIRAGKYEGYSSRYVTDELMKAPEPKRSDMLGLIDRYGIIVLGYAPEALRVARGYIEAEIIPASHLLDSLHVAAATVYKLDYIISYNFQHINRDKTRIQTAKINMRNGYSGIIICTAGEVLYDEGNNI